MNKYMNNNERKAKLDELGIPYPKKAKTAELEALLSKAQGGGDSQPQGDGPGSESADTNTPEEQVAPKDNDTSDVDQIAADEEAEEEAAEAAEKEAEEAMRAKIKAEINEEKKEEMEELNSQIKKMQSKKSKDPDEKVRLTELMKQRAKYNASLPRNLDRLMPSQMTVEEYHQYCGQKKKEIAEAVKEKTMTKLEADRKTKILDYKEGEPNKKTRLRIAAFRNPAKEKDLATFDVQISDE